MNRFLLHFIFLTAAVSLFGLNSCEDVEHTGLNEEGKPVIFVPVPPYAYIVEKLAGDSVELHILVDENDDPHTYSPTAKEIVALSRAMVYFTADLPFESSLVHKLEHEQGGLKVIDIVDNLKRREFAEGEHEHHAEEKEDAHDHHGHGHEHGKEYDPHVWLSPVLYAEQTAIIAKELQKNISDEVVSANIASNAEKLINEIMVLDKELANRLASMKGKSFYTYHGAFGYLAEAYGLKQQAIEFAGRSPKPKQIVELIGNAKADGVKLILVQPQFDQAGAKALAEAIGGAVVPINPMAKDVPNNLRKLAGLVTGKEG